MPMIHKMKKGCPNESAHFQNGKHTCFPTSWDFPSENLPHLSRYHNEWFFEFKDTILSARVGMPLGIFFISKACGISGSSGNRDYRVWFWR
jgi:hypothetical protein